MKAGKRYTGINLSGPDSFSDPLAVEEGQLLTISVANFGESTTVLLERRFNTASDTDWRTWRTYQEQTEEAVLVSHDCQVRIGAYDHGSGTGLCEIRASKTRY